MKNKAKELLKRYMSNYGKKLVIGGILFAVGDILMIKGAYMEGAQNALANMKKD